MTVHILAKWEHRDKAQPRIKNWPHKRKGLNVARKAEAILKMIVLLDVIAIC